MLEHVHESLNCLEQSLQDQIAEISRMPTNHAMQPHIRSFTENIKRSYRLLQAVRAELIRADSRCDSLRDLSDAAADEHADTWIDGANNLRTAED